MIPSAFVDLNPATILFQGTHFFNSHYVTSFEKWGKGFSSIFTCPLDLLPGYSWAFCLFNLFGLNMQCDSIGAALAHCLGRQHQWSVMAALTRCRQPREHSLTSQGACCHLSVVLEGVHWPRSNFMALCGAQRECWDHAVGQALSSLLVPTGWHHQLRVHRRVHWVPSSCRGLCKAWGSGDPSWSQEERLVKVSENKGLTMCCWG